SQLSKFSCFLFAAHGWYGISSPSTTPASGGTQPIAPSATTGASRTGTSLYTPGWATMGRAAWVSRSQLAPLFACQIPLKSGFALTGALALVLGGFAVAPYAQSAQAPANPGREFRTPWGEPDLQGIWSGETLTPLQRPARFANKPVLTPEEAAKVVAEVNARP